VEPCHQLVQSKRVIRTCTEVKHPRHEERGVRATGFDDVAPRAAICSYRLSTGRVTPKENPVQSSVLARIACCDRLNKPRRRAD